MKPLLQLFALVLEQMPAYNEQVLDDDGKTFIKRSEILKRETENIQKQLDIDHEKQQKKIQSIREKFVKSVVFDKHLS